MPAKWTPPRCPCACHLGVGVVLAHLAPCCDKPEPAERAALKETA